MSKKDFVAIAKIINNLDIPPAEHTFVAERFADDLAIQNANFKRPRFLAACGVSK